jgi:hypothetical protein
VLEFEDAQRHRGPAHVGRILLADEDHRPMATYAARSEIELAQLTIVRIRRESKSMRKNRVAHALGSRHMLPVASGMEVGR